MSEPLTAAFSMVRGGPSHWLQNRLGLLDTDQLPRFRTGLVLAAIAWLPLAVMALFDERSWVISYGASFFADFGSYARYLVGICALVIFDRNTDARLSRLLESFISSGVIGRVDRSRFMHVLDKADRRTADWRAEAVMVACAYAMSFLAISRAADLSAEQWLMSTDGTLSPAGWWSLLVSAPLYFFLVLRWLWRFGIWALLLRSIAKLPLNLVPTHPDRTGGIGFLTIYPMIFVPLTFVLSAVVASSALQEVVFASLSFEMLRAAAIIWVLFLVLILIGPLTVFTGKLLVLRESALTNYSVMVSRYNRWAEQRLYDTDQKGLPLETEIISGLADLAPGMAMISTIKVIPIERWAIIPMLVAALLPWVAVTAFMFPVADMVRRLLGALL